MIVDAPIATVHPALRPCPIQACGLATRFASVVFLTGALVVNLMQVITILKSCRKIDGASIDQVNRSVELILGTSTPLMIAAMGSCAIATKFLPLPETYFLNVTTFAGMVFSVLLNLTSGTVVKQHYPCGIIRTVSQNISILVVLNGVALIMCGVQFLRLQHQWMHIRSRRTGCLIVIEEVV